MGEKEIPRKEKEERITNDERSLQKTLEFWGDMSKVLARAFPGAKLEIKFCSAQKEVERLEKKH